MSMWIWLLFYEISSEYYSIPKQYVHYSYKCVYGQIFDTIKLKHPSGSNIV